MMNERQHHGISEMKHSLVAYRNASRIKFCTSSGNWSISVTELRVFTDKDPKTELSATLEACSWR